MVISTKKLANDLKCIIIFRLFGYFIVSSDETFAIEIFPEISFSNQYLPWLQATDQISLARWLQNLENLNKLAELLTTMILGPGFFYDSMQMNCIVSDFNRTQCKLAQVPVLICGGGGRGNDAMQSCVANINIPVIQEVCNGNCYICQNFGISDSWHIMAPSRERYCVFSCTLRYWLIFLHGRFWSYYI